MVFYSKCSVLLSSVHEIESGLSQLCLVIAPYMNRGQIKPCILKLHLSVIVPVTWKHLFDKTNWKTGRTSAVGMQTDCKAAQEQWAFQRTSILV